MRGGSPALRECQLQSVNRVFCSARQLQCASET